MTILKIVLYTVGFLVVTGQIIWKYKKDNQKLKVYDFILPIIFLWLAIKSINQL